MAKHDIKRVIGYVRKISKSREADGYDVEVVCSTEVVDRANEVIVQAGWQLDNFERNPVCLAAHQHRLANGRSPVIGSFPQIGVESAESGPALVGRIAFADTELGVEYCGLYRDKHMRAVSVGFDPHKGEWRDAQGKRVGGRSNGAVYHHVEQELIEVSAVAVGCNQEALARLREMGLDPDDLLPDEQRQIVEAVARQFQGGITDQLTALRAWLEGEFDTIRSLLPDDLGLDGGGAEPASATRQARDAAGGKAGKGPNQKSCAGAARALRERLDKTHG